MPSQYINKVVVNGETKVDLTNDTVDPGSLLEGTTAHDRTGKQIVGTLYLGNKDITDVTIEGNHVIIPPGIYARGIDIALENWTWNQLNAYSSLITDATGVESMVETD